MQHVTAALHRVAAFIDGDNLSATHADSIRKRAEALGRADVIRCYGNAMHLGGWSAAPGIEVVHAGTGKNAADILLVIDAVELCTHDAFQTVIIASSDRDFVHLANRLRTRGLHVVGMGEEKSPAHFRAACSEFRELSTGLKPRCTPFEGKLEEWTWCAISENGKQESGIRVNDLNHIMRSKHDVKISTHKEKTWRRYLADRPRLFDLDPRGPDARVRVQSEPSFGT